MSKRAERRHHYHRLKEKRKKYWLYTGWIDWEDTDTRLGRLTETPKPCSCYMCMNQRHNDWLPHKERITRQELKSEIDFEEQLEEYFEKVA